MQLRTIPASKFVSWTDAYKNVFLKHGTVPVNDKLMPLWDLAYEILLVYGSRGGGKSEAIADELINECLSQKYFKCYYGRKVFDNVRHSQFDTLVASIKKLHLERYFIFSSTPTGSMEITCILNNNMFIPFGSDQASKLKSIKDPTHIWCEEFDQFDFDDFKTLYPTLRTKKGLNRFIASFNSYEVLPDHWILKVFFPEKYRSSQKSDVAVGDLLKGKKVGKIFVNFADNYFIDQLTYRQTLWIAAAGNLIIFKGIAEGDFGVNLNETPYAYAFNRARHVSDGIRIKHPTINRNYPLILSFDFNRNPMTCTVAQHIEDKQKINILEVIKLPNSGVDAVCEYILTHYPGYLYIVTGDYNGDNVSSLYEEYVTHYEVIKSLLGITDLQIRIRPNPKQVKNSTHVNLVLFYYDICIHGENATPLVYDLEKVKRRADGTILKQDRDKPDQQADALDTFRYLVNEFLDGFQPTERMIELRPIILEPQSKDEYDKIRRPEILVLVEHAIDANDNEKAAILMSEIRRLDQKYLLLAS
jgi:phage terminase large subunit